MSDSLRPHGLYSQWNSPGQSTGVSSLSLLQGIFPTHWSNPGLLHCRQILYQLSHKWSPRILEWVAYPFSSGSSQLRNQTGVSCIAGGFFTDWAIREVSLKFLLIRLSINILINITKENLGTASAWGTAVVSIWFGFIHSTFSPKSTLTYFQGLPPQIFRWHYCCNTRLFPLSMMLWLKTFTFFLC